MLCNYIKDQLKTIALASEYGYNTTVIKFQDETLKYKYYEDSIHTDEDDINLKSVLDEISKHSFL